MAVTAVSIITVNWNNAAQTAALLRSLRAMDIPADVRVQTAVVDNGPQDCSSQVLGRLFPEINVIRSRENAGYAAAANLGIRHALADGADYIWLLNNDTVADSKALVALLAAATELARPAILSPLIYYLAEPTVIWFAGGQLDDRLKSIHVGQGERDRGQYRGTRSVDWVSGCAPFFSRQVLEMTGLWPTEYFLYLEDVDWCLAARERGIGCYVVGQARLWHDVSSSVNTLEPAVLRYYAWRNYYLLGRRRARGFTRWRVEMDLWWCLVKSGIRWLFFPAYRRDAHYHARTRGLLDLIRGRVGRGSWPTEVYDG